jgi:hypothetical protein
LIIGDRQTGKTTIAVDAIINNHQPSILVSDVVVDFGLSFDDSVLATDIDYADSDFNDIGDEVDDIEISDLISELQD